MLSGDPRPTRMAVMGLVLERRAAPRSPLPGLGAQRSQGFRGVLRFQVVVVRIGELAGRAIELDLFQGAQRDGAGTEVVFRVLALAHVLRFPIPVSRHLGSKDRSQD